MKKYTEMNVKKIMAIAGTVAVMASVTACDSKSDNKTQIQTSAVALEAAAQPSQNAGQTKTEGQTKAAENTQATENKQTTAAKQTDAAKPTEAVNAQNANVNQTEAAKNAVSYSSNGYKIEEINGITYVGGVLIANKTYSLPESFAPGDIDGEVKNAFNVMQTAAAAQGLNIYISSGYRSYSRQSTIYNNYVKKDGQALADTYSARAGHSEHQTGLCFDLNTIDDSFANTAESAWLEKHAQEYGFIIRYPKGKEAITGYQYEPWHLRYLGTDLATKVYNSGLTLEEYLGITSQYAN